MKKRKSSTLMDVAREAAVSAGTVSNYLKNPEKIKPVNRKRIQDAIDKLQFIPDINAQILATGKTKLVILYIVSEKMISPSTWLHQLPVIQVLHDEFHEQGYSLQISIAYADKLDEFDQNLRYEVERKSADGILILSVWKIPKSIMTYLQDRKMPYVLLDNYYPESEANEIYFDNKKLIEEQVEALYQKGHRRFRFIGVTSHQQDMRDRLQGFVDAMEDHDLSVGESDILYGDFSVESGFECVKNAIAEDPSFTAVIAGNDAMAVGAIKAIQDAGYKVPDDYSVCGVDNDVTGRINEPRLTTAEFDLKDMAKQGVECMMAQLHDKPMEQKRFIAGYHHIEGETVRQL